MQVYQRNVYNGIDERPDWSVTECELLLSSTWLDARSGNPVEPSPDSLIFDPNTQLLRLGAHRTFRLSLDKDRCKI